jgi:hypothetical protein
VGAPAPSLFAFLPATGDQVITVPNGTYSAGAIARSYPATSGARRGWVILQAQTQGGVIVDLSPPDAAIPVGVQAKYSGNGALKLAGSSRILFVGMEFRYGPIYMSSCSNIGFWGCSFSFRDTEQIEQGGFYPGYRVFQEAKGTDCWIVRSDFGETGTCIVAGESTRLTVQGCTFAGAFGSGTGSVHPDNLAMYFGGTDLQILDCMMRGRVMFFDTSGSPWDDTEPNASRHGKDTLLIKNIWNYDNRALKNFQLRSDSTNPDGRGFGVFGTIENAWFWKDGQLPGQYQRSDSIDNVGYGVPPWNRVPTRINVVETNVYYGVVPSGTDPATAWRATHAYSAWGTYEGGVNRPAPWATGSAPPTTQPPGAPSNVQAVALAYNSIRASWVVGSGTISFTEVSLTAPGQAPVISSHGAASTTATFGAAASTTYQVQVRHVNAGGVGPWSPIVSVTTPAAPPPPTGGPPSAIPDILGVGTTGFSFQTASTIVPAPTDGVQTGDTLLAWLTGQSELLEPYGLPAGWSVVRRSNGAGTFSYLLAKKIALLADETATSYEFTHAAGLATSQSHGRIVAVRNADLVAPIDDEDVTVPGAATTAPVAPALTTITDNCLLLAFFGSDNGASAQSYVPPTNYAELWDLNDVGEETAWCGNMACWYWKTTAGAVAAVTASQAVSEEAVAVHVALTPAAQWQLPTGGGRFYTNPIGTAWATGATVSLL